MDVDPKEDIFKSVSDYLWYIKNDPSIDIEKTTLALVNKLSRFTPNVADEDSFFWRPSDLKTLALDYIHDRMTHPGLPGFSTGFSKFDEMSGGFEEDNIYVFNAQSGTGKTTLLIQLAWAVSSQTPTIFFSPEARAQMMALKAVSALSGGSVPMKGIRKGDLTQAQWDVAQLAADKLQTRPFYIYDMPQISTKEMKRIIHRTEDELGEPVKAIFLDYLQQMGGEDTFIDLTNNMKELETLVVKQHVTCVMASQVGRMAGNSGSLNLTAGKGTGKIEELATMVIGIEKPDIDETSSLSLDEQRLRRILVCTKNRWEGDHFRLGVRFSRSSGWYEEEGLVGE